MTRRLLSAEEPNRTYADFVAELRIRKWTRGSNRSSREPQRYASWKEQLQSKEHFKGVPKNYKDAIDAIASKMKTI